jgi:TetR/AcrR family transcriptional repressor of lmrAB and yxaGH operons
MDTTRARLIGAAVRLMQQQGYPGTSVSDVLAEAQAPKGSLYHHFPGGKLELALTAVAVIAGEVDAQLERFAARGLPAGAAVQELASAVAQWLGETGFQQAPLLSLLGAGGSPREAAALDGAVAQARARWVTWFAAALAPQLPGDAAAQAEARLALAVLEGATALARSARDPQLVCEAAARLALHWEALAAQGAAAGAPARAG